MHKLNNNTVNKKEVSTTKYTEGIKILRNERKHKNHIKFGKKYTKGQGKKFRRKETTKQKDNKKQQKLKRTKEI